MDKEREEAKKEIDWMIADLEAEERPEVAWAIEQLRESRADLDGLDALQHTGNKFMKGVAVVYANLIERAQMLKAAGGRLPGEKEKATDIEREADRVAAGVLRPELTAEERAKVVENLRHAARLARDRAAVIDVIVQARRALDQRNVDSEARVMYRKAVMREAVRGAGHGTMLWRMNQERRRGRGDRGK